jgi:hypothetical protein
MTVCEKPAVQEFNTLLGGNASELAVTIAENPMLLDRLVSLLADVRNAATAKAKTRFRLIKSYWPNFETEHPAGASVSWIARDARNHRDIEVVYDFGGMEYSVRDKDEQLEAEEIKEALTMIYAILPERELKMIAIMQQRYETMSTSPEIKRAGGRKR